jgi:sulfate adenylyltransferase subunit 1 (EFTu-like GTPase family)
MPAKKAKPAWAPPSGLKIDVSVSRGDLMFRAETTPADAMNVARMLVVMARQITGEASDLLPYAESVPGMVLGYDWAEEYADGRKNRAAAPKKVGF